MLDGVPLRVLDPTWLRSLIGVVSQVLFFFPPPLLFLLPFSFFSSPFPHILINLQEPILFATSIVENIAYGRVIHLFNFFY